MEQIENRKLSWKSLKNSNYFGIAIVILAIVVFLMIATDSFLTVENVKSVLLQMSLKGMIAIGMTFVILMGGIDLSMGSVTGLGCLAAAMVIVPLGVNGIFLGIIAALAVGALCGFINGFLIGQMKLPAFLVTLGTLNVFRGVEYIITDSNSVRGLPNEWIDWWNAYDSIPPMIVIAIAVAIIASLFLKYTKYGRYLYAVGGNVEAARLSGVNTKRITISTYTLTGVLAGAAGILYLGRFMSAFPTDATGYELDGIAAAAIGGASLAGGKGTILGSMLGALVLALVSNGLTLLNVQSYYQTVCTGIIVIIAVMMDYLTNKDK